MKNPTEKQKDELPDEARNGISGNAPVEQDDAIPVSDGTQGNRAAEKMEERGRKKQETHEEAKSITGSEAHKDVTNEHPEKSPAPLDRY